MTLKHLTHDSAIGYAARLIAEECELTDTAIAATLTNCVLVPDVTTYPTIRVAHAELVKDWATVWPVKEGA